MTCTSTSASSSGRANAAAAVRKPLHVFRSRKRNASPTSCMRVRQECHNPVEKRLEVPGMEAFHKMFATSRSKFVAIARAMLNAALMIQRKRRLSRITPLPETSISHEANWMERIPAAQPDPEMAHAEQETLQVINEMLGRMKPVLRQAFTMTYYDELSGPEACARLGVSAGTFKARLFRARRQLLNQAQRAVVAPIRRSAVQHLVARPLVTPSLEASYS